ncbi:MAG: 3-oxoacyl-ACP synthase [Bacteroidia bacterium]|nr:3-oxoacyl-ACP synthase [Bacteroidia bacterium]
MKENYIISSYCSIQKNMVIVDNKSVYSGTSADFGEFSASIYKHFTISYPKFHKMDNLSKLAFLSVELLSGSKKSDHKYKGDEIGIILMNSSSSLDTDRHHQDTIIDRSNYFPSPSVFVYTLPNVAIGEISIRHKIFGEGNFFVMEKFNPQFIVSYIQQLFYNEIIKCCIAGWVEIDGNDYESVVFLIEKTDRTDKGIANFEPGTIQKIYNKMK